MAVLFDAYSEYYDLLYRDKDYAGEVRYVLGHIERYGKGGKRLLELGCGTGDHACLLAAAGYEVTAIDSSAQMVEQARRKNAGSSINFRMGDARDFRAERHYDTVAAFFHVASYQTTDDDIRRLFETASNHLAPGGLFIFDFWYGPAVLTQGPAVRVKRVENERIRVVRIAEPEMNPRCNSVVVKYQVLVENKETQVLSRFEEHHTMRYFFEPEIRLLLGERDIHVLRFEEWMSSKPPSVTTWGVVCLARGR